MQGNAIIGQSGGPTSVINSSLAGVIEAAMGSKNIDRVLGMNYGIEGFMEERVYDLTAQSPSVLAGLRQTPSSALGSTRHKVKDEELPKILDLLKKYNIRYFFLIGGNDTMDTINRVEAYCRAQGYELIGVGIPKTVDNDLYGTDHTPGFASAARSNILNVLQGGQLSRDMKRVDRFSIYQTIGRDAGWLAAATVLAKKDEDSGPHLIYTPERKFSKERFINDVAEAEKKYGWVSIVCGEGLHYEDGTSVSASQQKDKFNNTEFGAMGGASVGLNLHAMVREAFGWRGEFQITESLIMSDFVRAEKQDLDEAYKCGQAAVKLAEAGETGYMVSMERVSNAPYTINYGKSLLKDVAVKAKPMPQDFLNEAGNFPTQKFIDYCKPLISELPEFVRLEPKFYKV